MQLSRSIYLVVGLETHFTLERGFDLTLVATSAGEERSTELSLDEELSIENLGRGVEGRSGDAWVNVVSGSDGVRGQKRNNFCRGELSSIVEAGKNAVNSVCRSC